MDTKLLISLCAAAALLAACNHRDDGDAGVHSDSANGTGIAEPSDSAAGATTTPADPAAPPSDTAIPTDTPPPSETAPPADTQPPPSNPPQ